MSNDQNEQNQGDLFKKLGLTNPAVDFASLGIQLPGTGQEGLGSVKMQTPQDQLNQLSHLLPKTNVNQIPDLSTITSPGLPEVGQGALNPLAGLGITGIGGLGLNMPMMPLLGGMPGVPQPQQQHMPQYGQPRSHNLIPGSQQHAQAFHAKGPENEIKLFVGGLAFQTQESDLIEYFKQFGIVADAIVMRDRQTQRGRGFGFVKMQFEAREKAQDAKRTICSSINTTIQGHVINDKKVDVKSADDYVKPPGQPMMHQQQSMAMQPMMHYQPQATSLQDTLSSLKTLNEGQSEIGGIQMPMPNISQQMASLAPMVPLGGPSPIAKPNPYVLVEGSQTNQQEVKYKYPKSKIFVGGLDFKLTNEDLKQHFLQFGDIESAVILKDINTGTSRGFGFVTFKEESVAQDLIKNKQTTSIFGRKVDIKSAEPKQSSSNQPAPVVPRRTPGPPVSMIPQYGNQEDSGRKPRQPSPEDNSVGSYENQKRYEHRRDDRDRDRRRERDDYHHSRRRDGDRDRPRYDQQRERRRYRSPDSRDSSDSYRNRRAYKGPHREKAREEKRSRSRSHS